MRSVQELYGEFPWASTLIDIRCLEQSRHPEGQLLQGMSNTPITKPDQRQLLSERFNSPSMESTLL